MTFKKGKSGNPSGRPQGAISKRTQIAKLLEPHSEQLIAKVLELALAGDINALRLCMERLVPKPQREPLGIQLPKVIDDSNIDEIKNNILNAVFDGVISVDHGEKLINLVVREVKSDQLYILEPAIEKIFSKAPNKPA